MQRKTERKSPMDGMTKEKWHAFTKAEKREYIWDYYKVHILAGVAVLTLFVWFVVSMVTYREPYLEVIMVNSRTDSKGQQAFHEFLQQQDLEVFDNCVALMDSFHIDLENSEELYESMQQLEALYAVTSAGKQDLLFDTEAFIDQCAEAGTLMDLYTVLTDEELERYAQHLIFTTEGDTCNAYPCAIRVRNNGWIKENGFYGNTGALAILEATDDFDLSVEFLRYYLSHFD